MPPAYTLAIMVGARRCSVPHSVCRSQPEGGRGQPQATLERRPPRATLGRPKAQSPAVGALEGGVQADEVLYTCVGVRPIDSGRNRQGLRVGLYTIL